MPRKSKKDAGKVAEKIAEENKKAEVKEGEVKETELKVGEVKVDVEAAKEKVEAAAPVIAVAEVAPEIIPDIREMFSVERWKPITALGKKVFSREITSIDSILDAGMKITEPEIVDKLVPNIKSELILIGGRTGKGGGIQRIPVRITAVMHKSGRRFTTNAFVAVGNENGLLGMGKASAVESRDSIEKATQKAKMNVVKIVRGCGSWQCGCDENHSIKYKTYGKCGSVRVELLPAPKGVGLATDVETRKILRLAGIKDMWIKTYGNTSARINLASATFDALKKLYIYERQAAAEEVEQVADVEGETVVEAKVEEEQDAKKILEEAKKEVEDVEKEAEEDEAAEEELEKEGEAEGLVGAEGTE